MIEILAVLGAPIAGAALLASIGEREHAAEINVGVCLVTFVAAVALTVRVIADGPLLARRQALLRRSRSTCSWSR